MVDEGPAPEGADRTMVEDLLDPDPTSRREALLVHVAVDVDALEEGVPLRVGDVLAVALARSDVAPVELLVLDEEGTAVVDDRENREDLAEHLVLHLAEDLLLALGLSVPINLINGPADTTVVVLLLHGKNS